MKSFIKFILLLLLPAVALAQEDAFYIQERPKKVDSFAAGIKERSQWYY